MEMFERDAAAGVVEYEKNLGSRLKYMKRLEGRFFLNGFKGTRLTTLALSHHKQHRDAWLWVRQWYRPDPHP